MQANVIPNCDVTAQNINFGQHGVLDTQVDATGGVGVTCTPGTAYTVGLNNGLTGTGPTARRMTLGSQAVIYGLYKDTARSQPWGNSGGNRRRGDAEPPGLWPRAGPADTVGGHLHRHRGGDGDVLI